MTVKIELFHLVADPASARVRKRMTGLGLESRISFRNVHFETHRDALAALGGGEVPALWDGAQLVAGEGACVSFLERLASES